MNGERMSLLDDSPLPPRLPAPPSSRRMSTPVPAAPSTPTKSASPGMMIAAIDIQGMTCHACVNNIQDNVSTKPGIKSIVVSLAESEGKVVYDSAQWTGTKVAEIIDDMGFDATLKMEQPYVADAPKMPSRHEAVISIKGMTCHACVNNIQDNISKKPGVIRINVDLKGEQGVVIFDDSITTGAHVAEAIDDMGFDAQLMATRVSLISLFYDAEESTIGA